MRQLSTDVEDVNILSQEAEDVTEQQKDIDEQINSIFSEVGSDKNDVTYHFQVWRVLKDQADMAFLFKGYPSDLPIMERLRDEYEGGKFFIQIYKNKKRYRRLTVNVEPPKKNPINEVKSVKNDLVEVVRALGEQQQQQFLMLKETLMQIAGRQNAPSDPMQMMNMMLNTMVQMKNFISPPTSQTVSPDKMVDILIKGMEIGKESGGGGETGFLDIIKELIKSPALEAAFKASQSIPHSVPQIPNAAPANVPVKHNLPGNPNVNTSQNVSPEDKKMNSIISHNLNLLVRKAEENSDPILYAEFILDNVPDEIIKQYIMRDDLIEEMKKINPKVEQYKEWFLELRNHIQAVLTGEGEELETDTDEHLPDNLADDPLGSGGDKGNT